MSNCWMQDKMRLSYRETQESRASILAMPELMQKISESEKCAQGFAEVLIWGAEGWEYAGSEVEDDIHS